MRANISPNAGVFEDQRMTKPVSPLADEGFADFGGIVRRVARVRVERTTLWVQPVFIPAVLNLRSRRHEA